MKTDTKNENKKRKRTNMTSRSDNKKDKKEKNEEHKKKKKKKKNNNNNNNGSGFKYNNGPILASKCDTSKMALYFDPDDPLRDEKMKVIMSVFEGKYNPITKEVMDELLTENGYLRQQNHKELGARANYLGASLLSYALGWFQPCFRGKEEFDMGFNDKDMMEEVFRILTGAKNTKEDSEVKKLFTEWGKKHELTASIELLELFLKVLRKKCNMFEIGHFKMNQGHLDELFKGEKYVPVLGKDLPFMGATPDRILWFEEDDSWHIVEIKCAAPFNKVDGSENEVYTVPYKSPHKNTRHYYVPQMMLQMFLSGIHSCYYMCWTPSKKFCSNVFRIDFSREYMKNVFIVLSYLYKNHISGKKEPPKPDVYETKGAMDEKTEMAYNSLISQTSKIVKNAEQIVKRLPPCSLEKQHEIYKGWEKLGK